MLENHIFLLLKSCLRSSPSFEQGDGSVISRFLTLLLPRLLTEAWLAFLEEMKEIFYLSSNRSFPSRLYVAESCLFVFPRKQSSSP